MIPEIVFNATLLSFFDPVRRYLDDPSVTEVMINGPGKYPGYNFYRVAGLAIGGKDKGEAENEERPVDARSLMP